MKNMVRRGFVAILALPLYACTAFSGGPIEGQLLDADNGKPLTSAVVYGIWEGARTTMRTNDYCIWAESVAADSEGRFKLPAWTKRDPNALLTSNIAPYIYAYAPGYSVTLLPDDTSSPIRVRPFQGTSDERFRQLRIVPCVPAEEKHRLARVYRLMADEKEHLAVTAEQRDQAQFAREMAKIARTNRAKPTVEDNYGFAVNANPADQYPDE